MNETKADIPGKQTYNMEWIDKMPRCQLVGKICRHRREWMMRWGSEVSEKTWIWWWNKSLNELKTPQVYRARTFQTEKVKRGLEACSCLGHLQKSKYDYRETTEWVRVKEILELDRSCRTLWINLKPQNPILGKAEVGDMWIILQV
jgi:hypothetical protein